MSLHYTQRDALGRVISLLHDNDEMPTYESQSSHSTSHSPYTSGQKGSPSYPNTPDLMRSDSYDSQASGHESPLTPNSGYQEPLFLNAIQSENGSSHSRTGLKDASARLYSGEVQQQTLPPISFFHKVAGTMEPRTAAAPEVSRQKSSNPYGATVGATSSSSSLEEFHYRHSMESYEHHRRAPVLPDPAMRHSIEQSDDSSYHEQPQAEHRQLATRHDGDKPESDKKGTKSKNGSQKRYPCKDPNCDRTFTTSGHASRHAKIHEGLKPIPCTHPGCPKRFTRQDNMKQHLETHRKDKARASAKQTRRPSLATRRQSASSRGSVSRYSTPRDTPPLLSPALHSTSMLSPGLSSEGWARPGIASRTPSGLDALAMVAATEQATVEHQDNQRQSEHFSYWQRPQQPHRY